MKTDEILAMQEFERKRIAEELHDTTVQDLVCLSQQIELALLYLDKDIVQSRLELLSAKKNTKRIINEMRDIIYDLRPTLLDDIGWSAAFNKLKDNLLGMDSRLNINFDIDEVDTSDGITAISIYRIVCEACKNIIKHADADSIWVKIKLKDNNIYITIRDNGKGFDNNIDDDNNHFGIYFMKERVNMMSGKIKIVSDEKGTLIGILIPN